MVEPPFAADSGLRDYGQGQGHGRADRRHVPSHRTSTRRPLLRAESDPCGAQLPGEGPGKTSLLLGTQLDLPLPDPAVVEEGAELDPRLPERFQGRVEPALVLLHEG